MDTGSAATRCACVKRGAAAMSDSSTTGTIVSS